ncbi:MAG: hypothetical protein JXA10_01075 [Anaerolineae bacterium]|nr:hypothetical protein [Anaerolineae bacterium]
MMTLQEVIKALDVFSLDELIQLRTYIDQRTDTMSLAHDLTPEERAHRLDTAFEQLREGLTPAELNEITEAMNVEYIEPFDEELWKD